MTTRSTRVICCSLDCPYSPRSTLVHLTPAVCEDAGRLDPPGLRSLDAIHLAAALDLGDDLEGLVTYDDRLAEAAVSNGVAAVAPR